MNIKTNHYLGSRPCFLAGVLFLSTVFIIELIAILALNSGRFIYTLDDPYIHLALAENIAKGHYGINLTEFSAPSSSILWPFILAPFSRFKHFEAIPLLINLLASIGTIFFFTRILHRALHFADRKTESFVATLILMVLIVCTNVAGLIFTGMEHSLQVLLAVMIIDGLTADSEGRKGRFLLAISMILAPLIRYENLALSLAAVVLLCFRKRFTAAIVCTAAIALLMGAFSFYLTRLGLGPLPASVLAKSTVAAGNKDISAFISGIFANLASGFTSSRGLLLIAVLGILSIAWRTSINKKRKLLAGSMSIAILIHLLAGAYGGFNRYEIYVWTATVVTAVYVFGEAACRFLASPEGKKMMPALSALFCLTMAAVCFPYINGLFDLPLASNNIYEQHFQMRQFAVDFYRKPVAVNDIGLVSFRNAGYVLDLGGLASTTALTYNKMKTPGSAWIDELAKANGVQFAMIYETWYDGVPGNWIKAGELHLGKRKVTPAESVVSFFACDSETYNETRGLLEEFGKTLPGGVRFVSKKIAN
ncbi:MAG: hypothetical protein JXA18_11755 [Chitinispirillaceae bacterium]|nr:hypothetical protein [Chitinispirillaceae bacterium]